MVPEIKKILFISDLSQSSKTAFYYAASLAHFYRAQIDILHAIEDIPDGMKSYVFNFLGDELSKKYEEKRLESARSVLIGKREDGLMVQKAMELLTEDSKEKFQEAKYTVDQIITKDKEGDIAQEITKQCQKVKYDMIVISYKCFLSFTGVRAGSKIKKAIKNTDLPLLLVPIHEEEWIDEE